jgi:2-polyprenyl-3-methyl-5-hydroxy-6-metoxy-1,4-benzoquinol methylase
LDATQWDDRYRTAREGQRVWSAVAPQLVQDTVSEWTPGRALDLATGEGRTAIWLAGQGWQVTGADFSSEAISQATDRARDAGLDVNWIVADATSWEPEERFDLITMMYLQLPAAVLTPLLAKVAGWLNPGGHLLVLSHDVANIETGAPGPRDPAVLHTPELLAGAVDASRIVRCETVRRYLATDPESAGDEKLAPYALDTILVATA